MKLNLTRALILFAAAYVIVSVLAVAISLSYGSIFHIPEPPPGTSPVKAPVFLATVPYHVLVMLIVWPLFARLYFKKSKKTNTEQETLQLALLWLVMAMLVDCVCFVVIQTPFSLTWHQFYVDYQPWISLIYLAIFLSPWVYIRTLRLFGKKV